MKKSKKAVLLEQPNFVEDFYIGGTHVKIADNYCKTKTNEDIENTLERIAEIAVNGFIRQQEVQIT